MMRATNYSRKSTVTKKIGLLLMLLGGAVVPLKVLGLLPQNEFLRNDLSNYLYLSGAFLMLLSHFRKRLNGIHLKLFIIATFVFGCVMRVTAQDYTNQLKAFEKAFAEKSVDPISPYVSSELKFDPVPIANTPAVLHNIVNNLPKLNGITPLETVGRMVSVQYDFESLGIRESAIHFDSEGKFSRIELIENLIQEEIKAQQRLKQSVQQPSGTELSKKYTPDSIAFESKDGLIVRGNLYEIGKDKPIILLGHQAGYNRNEYLDIAPKLNELGFNCLAIDLRSGGDFANTTNETANRAKEQGQQPSMIDAQQDIVAAINYLYERYRAKAKLILWGSSYSASLSLIEGVKNNKVSAVIAFSPGDYFEGTAPSLADVFAEIEKPYLVTSSKTESPNLSALIGVVELKNNQSQFIPQSEGFHGSRVLWTGQKGAEEYWKATIDFLNAVAK